MTILEDLKEGRLVVVPREPNDKMMLMGGFRFAGKVPNSEVFKEVRKGWDDMLSVASPDHTAGLIALVGGMEAKARESAMQSLADGYQAEEAYAAQKASEARALAAEAERDALREALAEIVKADTHLVWSGGSVREPSHDELGACAQIADRALTEKNNG